MKKVYINKGFSNNQHKLIEYDIINPLHDMKPKYKEYLKSSDIDLFDENIKRKQKYLFRNK